MATRRPMVGGAQGPVRTQVLVPMGSYSNRLCGGRRGGAARSQDVRRLPVNRVLDWSQAGQELGSFR